MNGFWNNPEGNPHPPDENSEYTSPWKAKRVLPRDALMFLASRQDSSSINPSPSGILQYTRPVQYQVRKTGYYCVGKFTVSTFGYQRDATSLLPQPSSLSPSYVLPHNLVKHLQMFPSIQSTLERSFSRIPSTVNSQQQTIQKSMYARFTSSIYMLLNAKSTVLLCNVHSLYRCSRRMGLALLSKFTRSPPYTSKFTLSDVCGTPLHFCYSSTI